MLRKYEHAYICIYEFKNYFFLRMEKVEILEK